MKKIKLFYISILFLVSYNNNFAQEPCSEIKVAVYPDWDTYFYEKSEVYNYFQEQYGPDLKTDNMPGFSDEQSEEDWQNSVHEYLFKQICEFNPEVHFVSKGGDECDYSFDYNIGLIGIDTIPYSYDGVTGYQLAGKLSTNNECGKDYAIDIYFGTHLHLSQAIKNMIAKFGPIDRVLYYYEKNHIAPPRGPKILTNYKDRNYLSPLENERKLEFYLEVRDCKNQIVFEHSNDGQEVRIENNLERAKLKNNIKQHAAFTVNTGNPLVIRFEFPKKASIFYELKNGVKPEIAKLEIETCGRDRKETKILSINIHGLEILVKPQKSVIKSGESTNVDLCFNTVSPSGEKWPVAGKELNISVKGIVDGSISPKKMVVTNSEGKATLKYKAGRKDEKITISASYQPVKYPDKIIGSSTINVIPNNSAWNGKLTYKFTTQFACTHGNTINEIENREQFVELLLSIEKIDFVGMPVAKIKNVKGSGNITIKYSSKSEETRKEYYGLKTIIADNTFSINEKNLLGLLIQKKMNEDPEAMKKRFEELSKTDPGKLMEEVKKMSEKKIDGEFPIEIVLNVSGHWPIMATSENVVKSRFEDKNDIRTEEMPFLFKQMEIKLSGTMSLNSDGTGTINAFYSASEDLPNGKPSSFGCPPIKGFADCKLMLVKTKAN